ncbi:MAG: hypothetical protein GOVbin1629_23 [Prokaryotic dsDNA virus sp.]|nr:MAG: hypothetical protein GOVbin1629_23 [Prokaryotic dsDNA virus sp.]|tara:strand:+ start:1014 stop:1373 length:360 start_codon:yes stop_codon:yes gene_type:complete
MVSRQRSTGETKYILEEDFVEGLQEFGSINSLKIAYHIDRNDFPVIKNNLITTILGGLVMDADQNPITFAIEVYKDRKGKLILSDVKQISMDEYLDLMNLNQILKPNETRKSKVYKRHG